MYLIILWLNSPLIRKKKMFLQLLAAPGFLINDYIIIANNNNKNLLHFRPGWFQVSRFSGPLGTIQLILSNLQNIEYFSLVEIQSMNKLKNYLQNAKSAVIDINKW